MPDSVIVPSPLGFLLVLARMAGLFAFVPIPGMRSAAEPIRAVFALAVTLALFARWPAVRFAGTGAGRICGWVLAEAALGLAIGLIVAFILEAFAFAAQIVGLQAGYAYASTIDPNTQADSGVLIVLAQLAAGLMFFALGFDRELVRLLALSLDRVPPGHYALSGSWVEAVTGLGNAMFSAGLRLAFPVIALLLMVDVSLALLGRLNSRLQLLSLAFPAKMLAALVVLSAVVTLFPRLLRHSGEVSWRVLHRLLGT